MTNEQTPNIVWPIEPFGSDFTHLQKVGQFLSLLYNRHTTSIKPVTVVNALDLGWPKDLSDESKTWLSESAKDHLKEFFKMNAVPGVEEPQVIFHEGWTLKDLVQATLRFASDLNASFIILNAHTYSLIDRLVVGSFTETLLSYSTIPVLSINPHAKAPEDLDRVLFASDMSDESRGAFDCVVRLAKEFRFEIVLMHKFIDPNPIFCTPMAASSEYTMAFQEVRFINEKHMVEMGKQWAEDAKVHGVRVSLQFDYFQGRLPDAIRKVAGETNARLIALRVPLATPLNILVGSTPRSLFREAECPVMAVPHSAK